MRLRNEKNRLTSNHLYQLSTQTLPCRHVRGVVLGKCLLHLGMMMGLFDIHVAGIPVTQHYRDLAGRFRKHIENNADWSVVFEVPKELCEVLALKS